MLEIEIIYELYIKEINYRINNLLQELDLYNTNKENFKTLLINNEKILTLYTNVSLNDILNSKDKNFIYKVKFPSEKLYINGKEINFKAVKLYTERYLHINNICNTLSNKINILKKQIIDFSLYLKIVKSFNTKVINEIVNNNYKFNIVPSFGAISVIKNENHRKRVNWGESNKKKKEILERGGIPYVKADAESIENYQGEEWLSYHPPIDFFLHWHVKSRILPIYNYLKDYKYTPARGTTSIVTKLNTVKRDRQKALKLYTRTL